ncbi:hypothetical protein DPEC_G00361990 [Dallia pectoralis]|nr:hypothetical protein DPEC_G00361990 [Dallia pectoralis]
MFWKVYLSQVSHARARAGAVQLAEYVPSCQRLVRNELMRRNNTTGITFQWQISEACLLASSQQAWPVTALAPSLKQCRRPGVPTCLQAHLRNTPELLCLREE